MCGSTHVKADAFAEWDEDTQRWALSSTFDKGSHCDRCEASTRLETVPLSDVAACQSCDWRGMRSNLKEIKNVFQRVKASEPMPAGECPDCGALAHLVGR